MRPEWNVLPRRNMPNRHIDNTFHRLLGQIVMLLLPFSFLLAEDTPRREAVEFTVREGLPNFFYKLKHGEDVTIAYLGGSITAQEGWRVLSQKWFAEQFPQASLNGVHAAIGGTGSDLGAFRVEKDALSAKPDLLFVEFAVNDRNTGPEQITKAMEGIVRKTWQANPETDICFIYTTIAQESPSLAEGMMMRSSSTMEAVADHYGIPSVDVGYSVALLEKAGKLVMKTNAPMVRVSGDELNEPASLPRNTEGRIIFAKDGVHPYPETGHVLYTDALIRAMNAMRPNAKVYAHTLSEPLHPHNWESAEYIPLSASLLKGEYTNLTETGAPLVTRFSGQISSLFRLESDASLTFRFKGTKVMVYDILGPDSGSLQVTIDDMTKTVRRMDKYCTYHRLGTLGIGDNLPDTIHTVTIQVLDTTFDKAEVLGEDKRTEIANHPEKYSDYVWYAGAIFILGEMVEAN